MCWMYLSRTVRFSPCLGPPLHDPKLLSRGTVPLSYLWPVPHTVARDVVPEHNTPYHASLVLKNFHLFKKLPPTILRMAGMSCVPPPPPRHVPHHSLFQPYGPHATVSHQPHLPRHCLKWQFQGTHSWPGRLSYGTPSPAPVTTIYLSPWLVCVLLGARTVSLFILDLQDPRCKLNKCAQWPDKWTYTLLATVWTSKNINFPLILMRSNWNVQQRIISYAEFHIFLNSIVCMNCIQLKQMH